MIAAPGLDCRPGVATAGINAHDAHPHPVPVPQPSDERNSVYAILRLNSFDPGRLAASADKVQEFDCIHAAQPGFVGAVVVDLSGGRRLALNLWQSAEHSQTALPLLVPEVDRLLSPLMSAPSEFIGAGPVISSTLGRSTDP